MGNTWETRTMSEETYNQLNSLTNITSINLLAELFPEPPYKCNRRRVNPDLNKLLAPRYKEDYEQMESSSGEKLPVYRKYLGELEDEEWEILSEKEWSVLRHKPIPQIVLLEARIKRAKQQENDAGIIHYEYTHQWYSTDVCKKIDVPKLEFNLPEEK